MGALALAALFLLATHFGLSSTPLRAALVRTFGERGFLAAYSALAALALAWLVLAWRDAPFVPLWGWSAWQWFLPIAVMPLALVLVVCGLSQPNPSAVGQGGMVDRGEAPHGILRITRNPVMWGIGLWAASHMVPNGDLAGMLFFGTLAVLALLGAVLIDAKKARRHGASWLAFAAETSNLPFAAVASGRQSLQRAVREIGWRRLGVAVLLYAVLLHGHGWLVGVPATPPL